MIDCGTCKRSVRGPWFKHATTDSHARALRGSVRRFKGRAASIRRESRGVFIIRAQDPWSSDDGRDWDAEQEQAQS